MKSRLKKALVFLSIPLFALFVGIVLAIFKDSQNLTSSSSAEEIHSLANMPVATISQCCPTNPRMGVLCRLINSGCINTSPVPSITTCCEQNSDTSCKNLQNPCTTPSSIPVPTRGAPGPCCSANRGVTCYVESDYCPPERLQVPSSTVSPLPSCCPAIVGIHTYVLCPLQVKSPCPVTSIQVSNTPVMTPTNMPLPTVTCCPINEKMGVVCRFQELHCPFGSVTATPPQLTPLIITCCPITSTHVNCRTTTIHCPIESQLRQSEPNILEKKKTDVLQNKPFIFTVWTSITNFFIYLF